MQTLLKTLVLYEKLNTAPMSFPPIESSLGSPSFKYVLNALLSQNRDNYIQYNQLITQGQFTEKSSPKKRPVLNTLVFRVLNLYWYIHL